MANIQLLSGVKLNFGLISFYIHSKLMSGLLGLRKVLRRIEIYCF